MLFYDMIIIIFFKYSRKSPGLSLAVIVLGVASNLKPHVKASR